MNQGRKIRVSPFRYVFLWRTQYYRNKGGRGKWVPLTFLVFPRALCEEQLILAVWEVGWKKLIHEGAGKKDKGGRQTEPPQAIIALNSPH